MKFFTILAISLIAFAGCKTIEIENGQVPAEYLDLAKNLQGTYSGSFLGKDAVLKVEIIGNKPTLIYEDKFGADILGKNCDSSINNLVWVKGKEKNDTPILQEAAFALDAGNCRATIEGKEVILAFSNNYQTVKVYIMEEMQWERTCRWEPGNPPYYNGREVCEYNQAPRYITGKFKKD